MSQIRVKVFVWLLVLCMGVPVSSQVWALPLTRQIIINNLTLRSSGSQSLEMVAGSQIQPEPQDNYWATQRNRLNLLVPLKPTEPLNPVEPEEQSDTLQLNGPKVIGTRPGTPFLHSLAASGRRPMKFVVRNLPRGLKCNPRTGLITGKLNVPGTYDILVQVRNVDGRVLDKLTIVCGDNLALTPPLGWNSYDAFCDTVNEEDVLANARWLKEHLQPFGWDTVVVDIAWYNPKNNTPYLLDAYGRLQPAENRFPSSADGQGFKPLADRLHDMGLKFGIHIMRGIPRAAVEANTPILGSHFRAADVVRAMDDPLLECAWNKDMFGVNLTTAAGQVWYDSIVQQYAEWGVDYIKADNMSSPYVADEVEALRSALDRCGRSIILSLSPGQTPLDKADHVARHANMWRIYGDMWDYWGDVNANFDLLDNWSQSVRPGQWPDADMLPLGRIAVKGYTIGTWEGREGPRYTHLTPDEQVTLMTLWSIAPSPLMLGMNLPDNDEWTTSLLTNPEVLAVNQDPLGRPGQRHEGLGLPNEVWVKELQDGSHAVGIFNRNYNQESINMLWQDLGFGAEVKVRDLWQRQDLGLQSEYSAVIPAHGAVLLKVSQVEDVSPPASIMLPLPLRRR
jgi:hypothetical protein